MHPLLEASGGRTEPGDGVATARIGHHGINGGAGSQAERQTRRTSHGGSQSHPPAALDPHGQPDYREADREERHARDQQHE